MKDAPQIRMGKTLLESVESYVYLGVSMHMTMTFNHHAENYLIPLLLKQIGYFKKILRHTAGNARSTFVRTFWNAKLRPLVEYASATWTGSVKPQILKRIDQIQ